MHEKIVNFMTARDNLARFEGRDAIVGKLFGVHAQKAPEGKPVKDSGVKLI